MQKLILLIKRFKIYVLIMKRRKKNNILHFEGTVIIGSASVFRKFHLKACNKKYKVFGMHQLDNLKHKSVTYYHRMIKGMSGILEQIMEYLLFSSISFKILEVLLMIGFLIFIFVFLWNNVIHF